MLFAPHAERFPQGLRHPSPRGHRRDGGRGRVHHHVSEETGIVSYVRRGEITRYVDSESLKRYLKDYYWKEFNSGGKKA